MVTIKQLEKKYKKYLKDIEVYQQDSGDINYFIHTKYPYVVCQELTTSWCENIQQVIDDLETIEECAEIWGNDR